MKDISIILTFLLLIMLIGEELQALQRAKSGLKQLNRQARGAWGVGAKLFTIAFLCCVCHALQGIQSSECCCGGCV